jgi:hypothetical protein
MTHPNPQRKKEAALAAASFSSDSNSCLLPYRSLSRHKFLRMRQ